MRRGTKKIKERKREEEKRNEGTKKRGKIETDILTGKIKQKVK